MLYLIATCIDNGTRYEEYNQKLLKLEREVKFIFIYKRNLVINFIIKFIMFYFLQI